VDWDRGLVRLARYRTKNDDARAYPFREARFYEPWRAACKKLGAPGADGCPKRQHGFRRSAVRALETGGVPRSVAKRLYGHRTDAMYTRYSITTEDDLRTAVRNLHTPAPATAPTPAGATV